MTDEEVKAITGFIEEKICKNCHEEKCIDCKILAISQKIENMKGGAE